MFRLNSTSWRQCDLVAGLGDLAGARTAAHNEPASEGLQNLRGVIDVLGFTTGHHRQCSRPCRCRSTRYRRVDATRTAGPQVCGAGLRVARRARAHVYKESSAAGHEELLHSQACLADLRPGGE